MRNVCLFIGFCLLGACDSTVGGESVDAGVENTVDANTVGSPDAESCDIGATIVVEFDGGTFTSGSSDDPTNNVASVLLGGTSPANLSAFDESLMNTSAARAEIIEDIRSSVADRFSAYSVEVLTARPASGDYTLVVFADSPLEAGFPGSTLNPAPLDCDNQNASAVGFVFAGATGLLDPGSQVYADQLNSLGNLAAGAVGFGLGLELVTDCADLMGFSQDCTLRAFLDQDITCGTTSASACLCGGGDNQNSHATLLSILGPSCS